MLKLVQVPVLQVPQTKTCFYRTGTIFEAGNKELTSTLLKLTVVVQFFSMLHFLEAIKISLFL